MYPSYDLCRSQETFQRNRAANDPLPNVRTLAARAAVMWNKEAMSAKSREQREARRRQAAIGLALPKPMPVDDYERQFSENPDRDAGDQDISLITD